MSDQEREQELAAIHAQRKKEERDDSLLMLGAFVMNGMLSANNEWAFLRDAAPRALDCAEALLAEWERRTGGPK